MLTCPTHLPIYFCAEPVDFRKSFDGLTGVIASVFEISVLDGHLFPFINKRRDRIKAIFWDDDGFVICYQRLEVGTWQLPGSTSTTVELEAHELAMILRGIDLKSARRARYQQPIAV